MILIADGGSTKVDWIVLDKNKNELFRIQTKGLNPDILSKEELLGRLIHNKELSNIKKKVQTIYFYGAGCSSTKTSHLLIEVFNLFFSKAKSHIKEDLFAAVYAASQGKESIVCILGTGSNSCYFDGKNIHTNAPALGYIIMDEASGNYFGKKLLADYFYKIMPKELRLSFEKSYDLNVENIKNNLYKKESPNVYLGMHAQFMFQHKEHEYIHTLLREGFTLFFQNRILPYQKVKNVPIYFVGSIAYFFESILQEVALSYNLHITGILRRPIDSLLIYHNKI